VVAACGEWPPKPPRGGRHVAPTGSQTTLSGKLESALCVVRLGTVAEFPFPQHVIGRVENLETPLAALEAVAELRRYLSQIEEEAILRARDLGSNPEQIARALGITRQGVHYKLHHIEARRDEEGMVIEIPDLESPREPRQDET
jgi:hypothetical protein